MTWSVETLNEVVDKELGALPVDIRARFVHIVQLMETLGLPHIGLPHVRHLKGPLWEMRMKGRAGIARAMYVTASNKRVVVVRVFVKKTQTTPRREIDLALERAQEVLK